MGVFNWQINIFYSILFIDRFEISISQMTINLILVTKDLYSRANRCFYVDFLFPLSMPRFWPDLTVYMSNTAGFLSEARNGYPSRAPKAVHPMLFLVGSVLLVFLSFVCVILLCVFTFLVPCCDVRYDFRINTMSLLPCLIRYDNVTLSPLVQRGLQFGPIQRNGAN
jgi:hypothetical protein